jgi:hypothetical protein
MQAVLRSPWGAGSLKPALLHALRAYVGRYRAASGSEGGALRVEGAEGGAQPSGVSTDAQVVPAGVPPSFATRGGGAAAQQRVLRLLAALGPRAGAGAPQAV